MKKLFCLVIVLLSLASMGFAEEITFRDIPWGTNVGDATKILGWDAQLIKQNETLSAMGKEPRSTDPLEYFFSSNQVESVGYNLLEGGVRDDNCGFTYSNFWFREGDMLVGEQSISRIDLEFLYGTKKGKVATDHESSEFVKGRYTFYGKDIAIYDDIFDKLLFLYGEPVDSTENIVDYSKKKVKTIITLWEDGNGNRLMCYLKADGEYDKGQRKYVYSINQFKLEYGKCDISERITTVRKAIDEELRNTKYNAENTDGL